MPLAAPELDDRRFQDIVDEAKKRIPSYFTGWTDHNVSDPGVTMIELFAWMTEMILYRLNQVPDRHYIKFVEMLGIEPRSPQAARTAVTFYLSQPQPNIITIPAGTEVATEQTQLTDAVIYSTNGSFDILPPEPAALVLVKNQAAAETIQRADLTRLQQPEAPGRERDFFSEKPQRDDGLYLGFDNDLSQHLLKILFTCVENAAQGTFSEEAPFVWEGLTTNDEWTKCPIEEGEDKSNGLNNAESTICIHLPAKLKNTPARTISELSNSSVGSKPLYWLRLRPKSADERQDSESVYRDKGPRFTKVRIESFGGTTEVSQAEIVPQELLGQSEGTPGQTFLLQHTPILPRTPDEHLLEVTADNKEIAWQEVSSFVNSSQTDRHYTLDDVSGELRFGPAMLVRDGRGMKKKVKRYGAIPARGHSLYFQSYRSGGGQQGNVPKGLINTLKTSIPFVDHVRNLEAARDGVDQETLNELKERTPHLLRSRDRAVTTADFELLAKEALNGNIGRVKCVQPQPSDAKVASGDVFVLLVPNVEKPNRRLTLAQLQPKTEQRTAVRAYLNERRLLTTRLEVLPPEYFWVSVNVRVQPPENVEKNVVEQQIIERLNQYLNPLVGGPGKQGWPFGRTLYAADVYAALQPLVGIIPRQVELFEANPDDGSRRGAAREQIDLLTNGVIASGLHTVTFI